MSEPRIHGNEGAVALLKEKFVSDEESGPREQQEQRDLAESKPLWKNRTFASVFVGNTLSIIGEGFHSIAIGYWVLTTTGSAKAMMAIMLSQMAAGLLLGTLAGTFADRNNRRMIMLTMDLIRAALVIGVAAFVFGALGSGLWILVALSTLIGAASQFHGPAFQSSLVNIVGKEQIGRATGLMQVTDTLARLGGLSLGGFAVAAFGGPTAVIAVSATFTLSALCVVFAGKFPSPAAQERKPDSFWRDFQLGMAYVRAHPIIRSVSFLMPSVMIFFVASMMLFQVMAVTIWNATPAEFGILEAAIPIGYASGSAVIMLLQRRLSRRGWWISSAVVAAGPNLALLAMLPNLYIALPFVYIVGFVLSIGTVLVMILIRTEVAVEFQGRVFGTIASLTNLATPFGLAMSGVLADRFGADRLLFANGIGLTVIGIICIALLKSLRNYR